MPIKAPRLALVHRCASLALATDTTGMAAASTSCRPFRRTYIVWFFCDLSPYQMLCLVILSNGVGGFAGTNAGSAKSGSFWHSGRFATRESFIRYRVLLLRAPHEPRAGDQVDYGLP